MRATPALGQEALTHSGRPHTPNSSSGQAKPPFATRVARSAPVLDSSDPFPEIYLADGDVDLETGKGTQLLVDGLQRVSTMIQYFQADPELKVTTVPTYRDLSEEDKKAFLQYDVTVRDLGSVSRDEIIEAFRRLNATKYSLLDIEINNAVYAGAFKKYADQVAANGFFEEHRVFSALDLKRMGDLRYALTIIITFIGGYFNRDDGFAVLLERYNDEFPLQAEVDRRITRVFDFIEECGFSSKSRVWRKADLLTLIVELDQALSIEAINLQPSDVVKSIEEFYQQIDSNALDLSSIAAIYYKAALQASNDRINRLRRGVILAGVIRMLPDDEIIGHLKRDGMIE